MVWGEFHAAQQRKCNQQRSYISTMQKTLASARLTSSENQPFLEEYKKGDQVKYAEKLKQISADKATELVIELDDVKSFFKDDGLVERMMKNTRRYHTLFCAAVDLLLPQSYKKPTDESSPVDVMIAIRREHDAERAQSGERLDGDNQPFPAVLVRK